MAEQKTVLVVDDDATDFFLLRRGFEKAGLKHNLFHVSDVEEGLDYLKGLSPFSNRRQNPFPDLVLLDVKMPRQSGFEMLQRLKLEPDLKEVPVVIYSGSAAQRDVRLAYRLGGNCYIQKPVDMDEFFGVRHVSSSPL